MSQPFRPLALATSRDERDALRSALEQQAFRELSAAHLFSWGVSLAPTVDDKQMLADHAREELTHFEAVSQMYEDVGGRDLQDRVRARVDRFPTPTSWLEMAVAGFLFDRAVFFQLQTYKSLRDPGLDELVDQILENEQGHQAACEAALLDLFRAGSFNAAAAQLHVARWYTLALEAFDPSYEHATSTAGLVGGDDAIVAYRASIAPTIRACGLVLPDA